MKKPFSTKIIISLLVILVISPLLAYTIARFGLSQDNISFPAQDHSHFRIKYVYQGKEENFGDPRYQVDYTKDICSGALTTSPLHFHDQKTDYQHLHWANATGGQFLKFYGLNYIGGIDGLMGFKLDDLRSIKQVPIHSSSLPKPRDGDKFYIYSGRQIKGGWEFQKRNFDDFKNNTLEKFLGTESQVRKDFEKYGTKSGFDFGQIKAIAHDGESHKTLDEETKHNMEVTEKNRTRIANESMIQTSTSTSTSNLNTSSNSSSLVTSQSIVPKQEYDPISGEELKAINNFLGDIVIFVQKEEPSNEQIKSRFENMIKLDKSVCGG